MPLDDAIDWEVMGPKYRARVMEQDAEIARLRAALEEIAQCGSGHDCRDIAKETLRANEQNAPDAADIVAEERDLEDRAGFDRRR